MECCQKMAEKPRESGETEMIVLNALYLVRSAFAARIWDDRQRRRVPVYGYLSGGHRGGLMIVESLHLASFLRFQLPNIRS
jgi:hypothetical protein